jgi:hypothetical protein
VIASEAISAKELSSRPERSGVEGSAVSFSRFPETLGLPIA